MTNKYSALHEAVSALASVCDGAVDRDGQGFNGHDSKFGHRAAQTPSDRWTDAMAADAATMLRLYRGQLAAFSIDVDKLPTAESFGEHYHNAGRDDARQAERKRENAPYAKIVAGKVSVYNALQAGIKDDVKKLGFRYSSFDNHAWVGDWNEINRGFLMALGVTLPEDAPEAEEARPVVNVDIHPSGTKIILRTDFDQVPLEEIRDLPERKWNKYDRVNECAPSLALERMVEAHNLTISNDARELIDSRREADREREAAEIAKVESSVATNTDVPVALWDDLYPFQRAGAAYGLKHHRVMIGDDMGLGKTRQALSIIESRECYPAVVVCPASLKLNWRNEIRDLMPHRTVDVRSGSHGKDLTADITIINYDILSPQVEGIVTTPEGLVVDEFHYVKDGTKRKDKSTGKIIGFKTKRVGAMDKLIKRVPADKPVIMLSGTPFLNRPKELVQPLIMLGALTEERGQPNSVGGFLYRYCGASSGGWGTSFNGSSNEEALGKWLRKTCLVRREKAQVLTELPPKQRSRQYIELEPAARSLYEEMARQGAERAAKTRAEAIVYLNALREAIGEAKIKQALGWIEEFLATGKKLVVFALHQSVQHKLIAGLEARGVKLARILGGQSGTMTEREKDRFQNGDAQVIVCSLKAAREGHTLTAASDVLTVEYNWTPGEHSQAEDRCHRIGQDDSVTCWYLVAENTIDQWSGDLIESKRASFEKTFGNDHGQSEELSSIFNDLLARTLKEYGG